MKTRKTIKEKRTKPSIRRAVFLLSYIVTGILSLSTLAGCESEVETGGSEKNGEVPLRVTGSSVDAEILTRGVVSTGSMGVFRTAANGYSARYNVEYFYGSSGWGPKDNANTIYLDQRQATLCAYYPLGSVPVAGNSFTATLTAQTYHPDKDMQYAQTGGTDITNWNPNAVFDMKHAYARLKLSIIRHAHYVGACTVTNVNVRHDGGFDMSRTVDISTGVFGKPTSSGTGWSYPINQTISPSNPTNEAYDMLVPPQTVTGNFTVTLTVDGMDRRVAIPASAFGESMDSGKLYAARLIVKDVSIDIQGSINITDYQTDGTVIKNDTPVDIK